MNKLYWLFFIFFIQYSVAQSNSEDAIQVSVLTVGVADESHSLYGHTAIRIKNRTKGTDLVYNYGMFDFNTPNFIARFVKGDMQYFAGAYPYADFEYNYRYENRSIYEQILQLSNANTVALISALEESITGEDKFYTYKFIQRNCTTKVVDVINKVLQKNIIYKHDTSNMTYREILYPYAENQFFQKLGINIIFGAKTDEQATTLFLPFDLKNNLALTNYNNKPLVVQSKTLFEANRATGKGSWDSIYSLLLVLGVLVFVNKKIVTHTYFGIVGILGIFFSLVGFYSFHEEISLNYNVLLFNPILVLVAYFGAQNKHKAYKITTYIALGSIGLYFLYMLNKIHLAIVWPFIVANTVLLVRGIYKKKIV